jgi:NADH-quinone oxidoreductase subunit C
MKVQEIERVILEKLPGTVFKRDETGKTGALWSAVVTVSGIRDAAKAFETSGFFLEDIMALDFQDTFELVYRFNCYEPGSRAVIRVLFGHDQSPPSICDIFSGAGWLEREVHDFFGISFSGNHDMRPLLLPEDADYHPLRKDFGKVSAYLKREDIYG